MLLYTVKKTHFIANKFPVGHVIWFDYEICKLRVIKKGKTCRHLGYIVEEHNNDVVIYLGEYKND